jgi:hypothetical protein
MNISIGERWEAFVDGVVREGRYGSASLDFHGKELA